VFGGGETAEIVGRGNTCLVKDALYIPKLTTGIISVSRMDIAGYEIKVMDGTMEVISSSNDIVMVGELTTDGLYELTDAYKRMLFDPDCRNYSQDINEDILTKDGTWIYQDDESSESSDSSTPDEEVEEGQDERYDHYNDEFTLFTDKELLMNDIKNYHVNKIPTKKNLTKRRMKKQNYKWRKRERKWEHIRTRNRRTVGDYAYKAEVIAGKRRVVPWHHLKRDARVRFGSLEKNPLMEIHKKYGHLSESRIKLAYMYRKNLVDDSQYSYDDIKDLTLPTCRDCKLGKMTAFKRKKPTNHDWRNFEKIACDYKGPFVKSIWNQYTGYYLFSDYHSDYVWAYPVKSKDEQVDAIQAFWDAHIGNQRMEVQLELMIVLQSDANTITRSSSVRKWLNKHKVRLQLSTPYKKSENGQIERDIRNVTDRARTLLSSYDVPNWFWWYAVKHAIWLINRSPTSNESNKTPLEIVYGEKPNVNEMVPFFCPGFYYITKEEREPKADWKAKARSCRFLGYSEESLGYIVYDIGTKKAGIYHTDGRYVEGRSDICWDASLVELWYNGLDDLGRGALLEPQGQHPFGEYEYDPEGAGGNTVGKKNESMLGIIEIGKSNDYFPLGYSNDHCPENIRAMLHHELFQSRNEEDLSVLNMIERLQKYEETMLFKTLIDTDNAEELDQYISDIVMSINAHLQLPKAPKNEKEALDINNPDRDKWIEAIQKEFDQFDTYKTFAPADPVGHAMKTKFVFTVTFRSDYTLKYKARLVVCGYSQIKGVDYNETYAPTVQTNTVFLLLFLAGWGSHKVSVFNIVDFQQSWMVSE